MPTRNLLNTRWMMTWSIDELRANGTPEAGIALREWRKQHGVTLQQLAVGVGILSAGDLSAIETGRVPLTLRAAERIRSASRVVGPPNAELGAFDVELARLREAPAHL
jgi:transcriptional regulator with XRE-family HTH domain